MHADGTPEGVLQYNILAVMGDEFYLNWHANYDDTLVLCSPADLQMAKDSVAAFELTLPDDGVAQAAMIDYEPVVALTSTDATVRFVIFTKWGGFWELQYTNRRKAPHKLVDSAERSLVDYDCGISF